MLAGKTTRVDFGDLQAYDACLDKMNRSLGKKYSDYYNYAHPNGEPNGERT